MWETLPVVKNNFQLNRCTHFPKTILSSIVMSMANVAECFCRKSCEAKCEKFHYNNYRKKRLIGIACPISIFPSHYTFYRTWYDTSFPFLPLDWFKTATHLYIASFLNLSNIRHMRILPQNLFLLSLQWSLSVCYLL